MGEAVCTTGNKTCSHKSQNLSNILKNHSEPKHSRALWTQVTYFAPIIMVKTGDKSHDCSFNHPYQGLEGSTDQDEVEAYVRTA